MSCTKWKQPHKVFVMGLVVMSLVLDGSFVLLPLSAADNLAYAQRRGDTPPGGGNKNGKRPGGNPQGSGPKGNTLQQPQRSGQTAPPNFRRGPEQGPKNQRPGTPSGKNPGRRHGNTPTPSRRPGSPNYQGRHKPAAPPRHAPPERRHNPHATPPRPYYGHGRPLPPRPPHVRPPAGPGPWQTTPWRGHGPNPWWYGRPFIWSLTAAATATAIAGITYYIVNGIYYRPYAQGYTVVYVQVPPPY